MRFRSVRVQRLPFFAQVIATFERQLETIDVFRSFFPVGDVLEHERDRCGIFSKPFRTSQLFRFYLTYNFSVFFSRLGSCFQIRTLPVA